MQKPKKSKQNEEVLEESSKLKDLMDEPPETKMVFRYEAPLLGFYQGGILKARAEGLGWESLIVLDAFMNWYESNVRSLEKTKDEERPKGTMITQDFFNRSMNQIAPFGLIRMYKMLNDLPAFGFKRGAIGSKEERYAQKMMARYFQIFVKKGFLERQLTKSSRKDDPEDYRNRQYGSNRAWYCPTLKTIQMRPYWNQVPAEVRKKNLEEKRKFKGDPQGQRYRLRQMKEKS
jgi:hypothetical protein